MDINKHNLSPDAHIETQFIHAGQTPEWNTGALAIPISLSTTFAQESPGINLGFEYSRWDNPVRQSLEENIAVSEGMKYGIIFSSGVSAIAAVLSMIDPGMHAIIGIDVYAGARPVFTKVGQLMHNVEVSYVDFSIIEEVENSMKNNTKVIWMETFSNPMLNVPDLRLIADMAHQRNILVVVDSTLTSPYLIKPALYGADMVVHSSTKYIGGHCDLLQGIICTNSDEIDKRLKFYQRAAGAIPSPFECYLALRGMKTLHLRMKASSKNAMKVADFLSKHEKIEFVVYPGLKSHPRYDYVKREMRYPGGIVAFKLKGGAAEMNTFVQNLKIITFGTYSLGCVKSLIVKAFGHPDYKARHSLPDNILRFSVGVEYVDDIIKDLSNALDIAEQIENN